MATSTAIVRGQGRASSRTEPTTASPLASNRWTRSAPTRVSIRRAARPFIWDTVLFTWFQAPVDLGTSTGPPNPYRFVQYDGIGNPFGTTVRSTARVSLSSALWPPTVKTGWQARGDGDTPGHG